MQTLAQDLLYPTGIARADDGTLFATLSGMDETGRPGAGQVLRGAGAAWTPICTDLRGPVTGLCWHGGTLFVSEGGTPGRISRVDAATGLRQTLIDDLPGGGDYHTNAPVVHEGWLYFGQGAATNSGVVSWDAALMPWIRGEDLPVDLPGQDIVLADQGDGTNPGFQTFDRSVPAGTKIKAQLPCTSAVMRARLDGSGLELVAWGFRNPYGLDLDRHGRLLALDLGFNDRGRRPIGLAHNALWHVEAGHWYGWPDFAVGHPVTDPQFASRREAAPKARFLLANHTELGPVPDPVARLDPHLGPTNFACDPLSDDIYITLFGDKRPVTGVRQSDTTHGRALARLDARSGQLDILPIAGLTRPIDLCFTPSGDLLVVDFGHYELAPGGSIKTGGPRGGILHIPRASLQAPLEQAS